MTTEPLEGLVRIRGTFGEQIVTAKAWRAIYELKGFEYIGTAERTSVMSADDEPSRQLLERRSKVRGKSKEQVVRMAGGDIEEARLLAQAEMSGQNRPAVLEALADLIDSLEAA